MGIFILASPHSTMCPDMPPKLTVLSDDEDIHSVGSYDRDSNPTWRGRASRRSRREIPKDDCKVDGKIPSVLHTLAYYGRRNSLIARRHSDHAFTKIPDLNTVHDEEIPDEGEIERPIIEILTNVYSRRNPSRPLRAPRHRAPNTGTRPITAGFTDAPWYDDYSGDEDAGYDVTNADIQEPIMLIWSQHLKNALKAVVAYYPYFKITDGPLSVTAPYRVLHHHYHELVAYMDNQPAFHDEDYAVTTKHHIEVLTQDPLVDLAKEVERWDHSPPLATYDYFWLLLKPGSIMYAKRYDIWTPYVVSSVEGGQYAYQPSDHYKINAWLLESNGSKVLRFMETFTVAPWLGEQAIDSLPVVPAAYWKEDMAAQGGMTMRQKCIEEGRLYWDLLKGPRYMEYDGNLVNSNSMSIRPTGPTGFMSGRVIADIPGFEKYQSSSPERAHSPPPCRGGRGPPPPPQKDHLPKSLPRCGCTPCSEHRELGANDSPWAGFEDLDPRTHTPPLNEDFYLLLSNTVPGFILGTRRWGHLAISNLKPVVTDKEAFKCLQIDEDIKNTVKALIGQFATGSAEGTVHPWGNDFIKNKGEGRIFLFHGEPGVGKTCTAECIAELTSRPLLSLTAGDLSIDSWRVEQNLSYFLELGQRYGALVLLDEADVYLERRRSRDIDRNGLVSVFLRALEYYSGCIVISTNRVRTFDAAFMSRIHVALHYQNLRDEDRERIWQNNFDRLDRDSQGKVRVSQAAREYIFRGLEVSGLRWNGREIRNAMQTSLALAEAESEGAGRVTVGEKHIRAVVKMSQGFKDYMEGGGDEDSEYEYD